ncbi:hypothetical protein TPHA_0L01320 [Tetrapisispora phaffii CBS 4417]|uniref:C2H2-type domain-containing protein n=1 Tax=Tetrapisispora phaffii (strain ATCC 24235 / CBS 4417 / NBRC 1672 / NRRL Y-8282 / UCD 70-5) TaxID=1071381 RepID=G8C009_TETPH|nr:hypothetical protein TPHA_0L01320 [Tetrapisispora phaffii CBS 4417]CCE65487.1 hypothetical protein TPHA_0L01320 [Tetrapisispora phaffii CBS 4417]
MDEENKFYRNAVEAIVTICTNTNEVDPNIKILLERVYLAKTQKNGRNKISKANKPSQVNTKLNNDNTFSDLNDDKDGIQANESRIYKCNHCSLVFRRSSDVRRHERTHLRILPNICKQCGKGFARKDALKRHSNTLTCNRNRERLLSMGGSIDEILKQAESVLEMQKK